MAQIDTPPSVQAASDDIMAMRYAADELEAATLKALNSVRVAKVDLMAEPIGMMGMELGEMEAKLYEIAASAGKARHAHKMGSEVLRRYNVKLPHNPGYGENDLPEKVCVKIKGLERR